MSSTGPVSWVGTNLKEAADGAGDTVCTVILSRYALLMSGSAAHDKMMSGNGIEVAVGTVVAVAVAVVVGVGVCVAVPIGGGVAVFVAVGVWLGVDVALGVGVLVAVAVAAVVGVASGVVPVAVGVNDGAAVGAVLIRVGVNVGTTVGDDAPPWEMTGKKSVNARLAAPLASPGPVSAECAGTNDHLIAMATRPTITKIATRFMKNLSFAEVTLESQTHPFDNRKLPKGCAV